MVMATVHMHWSRRGSISAYTLVVVTYCLEELMVVQSIGRFLATFTPET